MLVATFGATVGMTMLIMLLPAILELKKPLDAGPRMIIDNFAQLTANKFRIALMNLEDESNLGKQSKINLADFHNILMNIEV
jgi:hypothetical protein